MKRLSAEARAELERRRVEIGSFGSVVDARAACERDAEVRCRQSDLANERSPVDVRISPGRRRGRAVEAKPAAGCWCAGEVTLDEALAAFAAAVVTEDCD